ncbi:PAS domain-containing hybrid sensor histidine kinase/response regulator [Magnetofaba australis]|uniref:histidine kinase n=1 Tax=Magnetofaba australis IT-1 TaxID=1434232 RepID=A0A1Y2K4R6_9PROT|nr:PAS domain-containing hybrid sensor histidine kinase/response regulator [Magnetofaba australis]OSM03973.1 putative two-component hybrid sensor and regulator [Magnetofaba australis IT-1]
MTEDSAQWSDDALAQGLAQAGVGVWQWREADDALVCNATAARLLGVTDGREGRATLRGYLGAVHEEDRLLAEFAWQACLEGAGPLHVTHRVSGVAARWVTMRGGLCGELQEGRRRLSGIVRDDTTRMRDQEDLAAVKSRAEKLLAIADTVILSLDRQGRVTLLNNVGCDLLGVSPQQAHGMAWFDAAPASGGHRDRARAEFDAAMAQLGDERRRYEMSLRAADGELRRIRWGQAVLRDEVHGVEGVLLSGEDITEMRRAQRALERVTEQAVQANRAKSEFLSAMSHELRTPLNAILGFVQLLGREAQETLSQRQHDHLAYIEKSGRHLLALITDVLDLARIEAGQVSLSPRTVALPEIVRECIDLLAQMARKRGVAVTLAPLQGVAGSAYVDPLRFKQIVLNLISNAIKYNREGGVVLVELLQATAEDPARVVVSDTGLGLTEDQLSRVFEPFQRLGAERSAVEGVGIGLALSRQFAQLMGGDLQVMGTPGVGAVFWLDAPSLAGAGAAPLRETGEAQAEQETPQLPSTPFEALYVEDAPVNARLMEAWFKRIPQATLRVVSDGRSGLREAALKRPDLVLLDLGLPDMDGFQVLEYMRETTALTDMPVIAVSADATEATRAQAQASSFFGFLTKPLDFAELETLIARALIQSGAANR